MEKWFAGKSFFANFLPYLMIFQSAAKLWKTIKYAKILAKNEEKHCSICLKPIFRQIPDTYPKKSDFGYTIPIIFRCTFRPTKIIYLAQILRTYLMFSAQKWRSQVGTSISYSVITVVITP